MIIGKFEDRDLAIKEAKLLPYPTWVIRTPPDIEPALYCITNNPPSSEDSWARTVHAPHKLGD